MADLFRYKEQETVRLSPDDIELIYDNYEFLTGQEARVPIGKLLGLAVIKACQSAKPKLIQDPAIVEENVNLKIKLQEAQLAANSNGEIGTGLQLAIDSLNAQLAAQDEELMQLREVDLIPGNMVLNFDEKQIGFFKACLEIYKKHKAAQTYEEMIWNIILNFQKAGYLKFTQEDLNYLKSLNQKPENE